MTVHETVEQVMAEVRDLERDYNIKAWDAATTGTGSALDAAAGARAAWMRYWANPHHYETFRAWDEEGAAGDDAHLARMVHLLHLEFAQSQQDPNVIDEMTQLAKDLDDAHTNFRAEVDGQRLTANDIVTVLRKEDDSDVRRKAWEASKAIGPRIADQIRRLAELRNQGARRMGYSDFHHMSLTLGELDPDWLFAMLDDLAAKTEGPFRHAKAAMDARLSERFGVSAEDLMPWHYAEPFFQQAPMVVDMDLNAVFEGKDMEALATAFYDGMGMDVRDILARSDLYEREGKDQHAFCVHMDREGDVCALCNLQPTLRWMETLLHELGHGVYDKYIPQELPFLLRQFPHILSTEAMAMLMGAEALDPEFHARIVGTPEAEAEQIGAAGFAWTRLNELIFARWVMVVVHFERLLYEDPTRDLDAAWWDLVQKYQLLNKPEGRETQPDWATKYHIALAPAYYQNYLLGRMMSLQWEHWLYENVGGIVNRPAAGDFFRKRVFALGATQHWNDALAAATGERLNPDYFVQKFAN